MFNNWSISVCQACFAENAKDDLMNKQGSRTCVKEKLSETDAEADKKRVEQERGGMHA